MKKRILMFGLVILFVAPCFGADPVDSRRENYVLLRDHFAQRFIDQDRYIESRFNSIDKTFHEKQRALEVGSAVLDAKFVRIDDFIKGINLLTNSLSNLNSRTTILETKSESQEKQAKEQWLIF